MVKHYEVVIDSMMAIFHLFITPTVEEMRLLIVSMSTRDCWPECEVDGVMALVHPYCRMLYDEHGFETVAPDFALVFFNEERLDPEFVMHESVHIAAAHARGQMKYLQPLDLGDECGEAEERLSYAVTDIHDAILGTLREGGHIKGFEGKVVPKVS